MHSASSPNAICPYIHLPFTLLIAHSLFTFAFAGNTNSYYRYITSFCLRVENSGTKQIILSTTKKTVGIRCPGMCELGSNYWRTCAGTLIISVTFAAWKPLKMYIKSFECICVKLPFLADNYCWKLFFFPITYLLEYISTLLYKGKKYRRGKLHNNFDITAESEIFSPAMDSSSYAEFVKQPQALSFAFSP